MAFSDRSGTLRFDSSHPDFRGRLLDVHKRRWTIVGRVAPILERLVSDTELSREDLSSVSSEPSLTQMGQIEMAKAGYGELGPDRVRRGSGLTRLELAN